MAKLLNDSVSSQVKGMFDDQLKQPVSVLFFNGDESCEYCDDTRQLLEEVTGLSEKLDLQVFEMSDQAAAQQYHIDKTPGFVLVGKDGDQVRDYGIRFYGIPSGHEFSTLIHDLILVSGRDSGLSPETRQALKTLDKPVHLQVFVTPT
jgi:glutaredoxin-like protein